MADEGRKSTLGYWESNWGRADVSKSAYLGRNTPAQHFQSVMHSKVTKFLGNLEKPDTKFLELGCGGSHFLPYFAKTFGFQIAGIDYSEAGCESAESVLKAEDVAGEIVRGDLFNPPAHMVEAFDVVGSFGLVEHFDDTTACLKACARFVKPNGKMITMVPNMAGLYGRLYKIFDRSVFDMHVPLTARDLAEAHRSAGLDVEACEHLLGFVGVFDPGRRESNFLKQALRRSFFQLSRVYFGLEAKHIGIPPNRFTSPYILCTAIKA